MRETDNRMTDRKTVLDRTKNKRNFVSFFKKKIDAKVVSQQSSRVGQRVKWRGRESIRSVRVLGAD